jgi:hypothetical protein
VPWIRSGAANWASATLSKVRTTWFGSGYGFSSRFYTLANVSAANLVYVNNVASGHAFISPSFGNLCATNASPFVNKCVVGNGGLYDQPGAILTQIYGSLNARTNQTYLKF